jgi:hypothetical protein
MKTVLVQIADQQWTMQAMHLACALARNTKGSVVLLRMMRVRAPYLLGSQLGIASPTDPEMAAITEYSMVAEDYGVKIVLQPMQYESFNIALVQAAEHFNATAIFASLPENPILVWKRLQLWNMRRQLNARKCQLFTLTQSDHTASDQPGITFEAIKYRSGDYS